MKIIVCVKQVPGTSNVKVDPVNGTLKRDGVESKMNPFDLFAIETALRIREVTGGTVTTLTMGPPQAKEVLLESICIGADNAVLLTDRRFAGADVLATGYTLSQGIASIGDFDLILCGKQTTDGDTAQVGPETAEFLRIPHSSNVAEIVQVRQDEITVKISLENSEQVQTVRFPCLLTVEKDIYTPRLPSFKRKLAFSQNIPVRIMSLDDFQDRDPNNYGLNGSPTQVERIFPPEMNNEKKIVEGTASTLSNELMKVLDKFRLV